MAKDSVIERFASANAKLPLVAILRGLRPDEAEGVAQRLYDAGFRLIEVPLNSPDPFDSIARIRRLLPMDALVGAGTVTMIEHVQQLTRSGGELVVMPHTDTLLIRAAKDAGCICAPGIATPTEAFAALGAGADALKIFPAELVSPAILKAMRVVLPKTTRLIPVGGITPDNMKPYLDVGAGGFGLGSALYAPGISIEQLGRQAESFVTAWASLSAS